MDLFTINQRISSMYKNIPAIVLAGMFFFSAYVSADSLQLCVDLFEKGEWALCRRECRRALLAKHEPTERFQLLHAISTARLGAPPSKGVELFRSILEENRNEQVTAMASYELGRLQWQVGNKTEAFSLLATSFNTTTNKQLFLQSACSIYLLCKEYPELKKGQESLIGQITTTRSQFYGDLLRICAKPAAQDDDSPPSWAIRFYRSQISPAIGRRCVLEPSCSEYFNQACKKHGLLGFPMFADRLFREPDVSAQKKEPVFINGMFRYRDSVENHDFWMKR